MSRIVMIRHGETAWNAERRSQGWLDPPLNEEGEHQAQLLGQHVRKHYEFSRVISSDSTRCTMTADALGVEYSTDQRLREINTGSFAGLLIADIREQFPDDVEPWDQGHGRAPEGESWLDLAARAGDFVARSGVLEVEGDTCLVSHGGMIRALLSVFLKLHMDATRFFAQSNTGVTVVSREGVDGEHSFGLDLLNSTEHLRG